MTEFLDFFNALSEDEWDEVPVDIEEFVTSDRFLNIRRLSKHQYSLVKAMSQIYREDTLVSLYGEEEGHKRFKQTCNEVVMQLGKGNFSPKQKFYSVDKGYVDSYALGKDGWMCDSRDEVQPAYPFFDEGADEIYRVTTKHGYSFDCGPNHKTPTWKNTKHTKAYSLKKQSQDVAATQLEKGDLIELKVGWSEQETPYEITSDEARLIGYMIGDGSWAKRGKSGYKNPMFTNNTPEVQSDIVRIVESLGGNVAYLTSGKGCWQIRINAMMSWFIKHGLIQEYNIQKQWNDQWLSMTNDNMHELIKGVIATDGWISFTAPGKKIGNGTTKLTQAQIGIEMTSESCIKGIHLALLKTGYISKFKKHRQERSDGKHNANYRVCITDTSIAKFLIKNIKDIPGKNDKVERLLNIDVKGMYPNNRFDRIESVEYIGFEENTVCTTVAVEGVLNAGGIITNNSGKDFTSTIAVAYIVYLLLCLKDPARYYGNETGDTIDILNIAINADQAFRVFFKNFKTKIENCPWFAGKYDPKANYIEFDKNVTVYSGHSEREAFEGYNTLVVILDEISGFAMPSEGMTDDEEAMKKTAPGIYKMYRGSITSRFPDFGKLVLLSFPRYKDDFIQQRYNAQIAEKEVITRTERLYLDPDLGEIEGNYVDVSWEEDHILRYSHRKTFALRRPSWEVNPNRKIQDYTRDFADDPGDALGRFACMPSNLSDGFFKNKQAIEDAFILQNGVDEDGIFLDKFQPKEGVRYFIHVDLAQKHDHCAVAIAHVEKWVEISIGSDFYKEIHPFVVVDAVRWWTPTKSKSVDFADVRDYIIALRRRGFDIKLTTFDRWNCVKGNAIVSTPSGPVRMRDIQVGDEVSTRHGIAKVEAKIDSGIQEVFRVTTRLGYEFEATVNHRVLTKRGWVTMGELTIEDEMLLDNTHEWSGVDTITESQAYALGGLIADGWINDRKNQQINFTTADEQFRIRMHDAMVDGWGFKNTVQRKIQDKTVGSKVDTYSYTYWDKDMIERMRIAGLTPAKSANKTVPHSVLNGSASIRAAFMAGYIDGDGGIQTYIDKSGQTRYRLTVDTISEELVKELVWISLSLELEPTRLRQKRHSPEREVHRLTFEGKKAERVLAIIKPSIDRKNTLSLVESREYKERWVFDNGQMWVKIKNIQSIGNEQTFDISVPEYEEFIADGFVTHNSHDTMNILENEHGIKTDVLSVALKHYDDFLSVMYDHRLAGPKVQLLVDELGQLKLVKKKVDHPRKGCFVGETRIPLLDGTRPMISELAGSEVWVYSSTPDGRIVPGRARGRLSKYTNEFVDVILDNGSVTRCTPDHRWMLRNGEYKDAKDLRPGIDRLMPINSQAGDNHKIRTVVPVHLAIDVPVYDLEVEEYENFAISGGVFVHNSKDLSDAVCGAIFNAVSLTPKPVNMEVEVLTYADLRRKMRQEEAEKVEQQRPGKVITPPKRKMPSELADYLQRATII